MQHAPADELLLFRAVEDPARRAVASRLLDEASGGPAWRLEGEADFWALEDAAGAPGEEPVAVAATSPLGEDGRVALLGFVVHAAQRGRGVGQRLVGDLCDALRSQGQHVLVAAVPGDQAPARAVVQRAGFRPCEPEGATPDTGGREVEWFGVEL